MATIQPDDLPPDGLPLDGFPPDGLPSGEILAALRRMGLPHGGPPAGARLTGGVSSDIWRIDLPTGPICVKRALPQLRVAADWQAPVERNGFEADWMRVAGAAAPTAVPALLGHDAQAGMLAMAYLPPDRYRLWKTALSQGLADPDFAALVGTAIAGIHAATARDPSLPARFASDAIFHDIRLEPYLLATARAHPGAADRLRQLAAVTAATRLALVHGDVSPKNILRGPDGPVFLDAECAWWGDPAFDLAFCLNHLLLKCLWRPESAEGFLRCFDAMAFAYRSLVSWEPARALEARAAHLLPALLLARVDGKSPVEYITADAQRDIVRRVALRLLADPPDRLAVIAQAWAIALKQEALRV